MPNVSRTSALIHNEMGPGEEYTGHLDGTTVNFVTIHEDSDLAPLLVGLPDDKCQCRGTQLTTAPGPGLTRSRRRPRTG